MKTPYETLLDTAVRARRILKGNSEQTNFTRHLEEVENKSTDEIIALQAVEMSRLLKHTVNNIPYYEKLKGRLKLEPETVHKDIKEFPVLTKEIILENFDKLVIKNKPEGKRYTSGGTSGKKAVIIRDKSEFVHSADEYINRIYGIYPGKSRLWIRRAETVYYADNSRDREHYSNFITRTNIVSPAYMDSEKLEYLYSVYKRNKPKLILGITEPIYRFAEYINDNNLKVYPVESIVLGGQTFMPNHKRLLEHVFKNTNIYDGYGATEFGTLSFQCGHSQAHHYIPVLHYVEAVDENYRDVETGEMGQFLVTNLHKRTMPLIRYRIDDLVTMSDKACGCGRGFPMIERFEGRRIESVVSPKLTYMTPLPFYEIMMEFENVEDFIVEQRKENTVTMMLKMKSGEFSLVQQLALRKEINRYLDYPMKLEIEYINEIIPLPNGKIMRVRGLESYNQINKNRGAQ